MSSDRLKRIGEEMTKHMTIPLGILPSHMASAYADSRFTVDRDALLSDTLDHAPEFRCGPCTTCRHCYRETPSEMLGERLQCDRPELDSSDGEYGFQCPPGFACSLWEERL